MIPIRPSKKLITQIQYSHKDPLWSNINFFQDQIESMIMTAHSTPFKDCEIRKMQLEAAIKDMSDIRDSLILSSYN